MMQQHEQIIQDIFNRLDQAGILNAANREAVITNVDPQQAEAFAHAIERLEGEEEEAILNQNTFNAIIAHVQHAKSIAKVFDLLNEGGLLTPENIAAVTAHAHHAKNITLALRNLDEELFVQENIDVIIASGEHAPDITKIFYELNRIGLLSPENRTTIAAHAEHAKEIESALKNLRNSRIYSEGNFNATTAQRNFDVIIANVNYLENIAKILKLLRERNIILDQPTFDAIMANSQHAEHLYQIFWCMGSALDLNIINIIAGIAEHAGAIAPVIIQLRRTNNLTMQNFHAIIENANYLNKDFAKFIEKIGLDNNDEVTAEKITRSNENFTRLLQAYKHFDSTNNLRLSCLGTLWSTRHTAPEVIADAYRPGVLPAELRELMPPQIQT